jgi:hypothetical protein
MHKLTTISIILGILPLISCEKEQPDVGSKIGITSLGAYDADLQVNVFVSGVSIVGNTGIVYDTGKEPHSGNWKIEGGQGNGNFSAHMSDLLPNTTYYVRAYAIIENDYRYGDVMSFTTDTPPYQIGDHGPAGGIVFYLDGTGGGMEVDTTSWMSDWGCEGQSIPGLDESFGHGKSNTDAIMNYCSESGIAARKCAEFNGGGFNDWYLPSLDELKMIYDSVYVTGHLPIQANAYLSSNESNINNSAQINFHNGSVTSSPKIFPGPLAMPVRSF